MRRLWIDTDAGVDDAEALLLAFAEPGWQVDGISAVTGNVDVEQVLLNVRCTLAAAGGSAPLFRGAALPINGRPLSSANLMGADGLGGARADLPLAQQAEESLPAALALVRWAREHAGEDLTLTAIGPLTNLALAVRLDPAFAGRITRLVIMGGTAQAQGNASAAAEFNFLADPEAAQMVLSAGFADVWVLPWETSVRYFLPWDAAEALCALNTRRADFFRRITRPLESFLRGVLGFPGMPMPDPLAMAVALHPEIVSAAPHLHAEVDIASGAGRGLLALSWNLSSGQTPNIHIITELNFPSVLDLLHNALS